MYKESFNKAASVSILKIEKGKLGIFTWDKHVLIWRLSLWFLDVIIFVCY
jgi:hypothetical protein